MEHLHFQNAISGYKLYEVKTDVGFHLLVLYAVCQITASTESWKLPLVPKRWEDAQG